MKHGKRPTRRQKEMIEGLKLNPDNWLIERDTHLEMVLIHRQTSNRRVIRKGA